MIRQSFRMFGLIIFAAQLVHAQTEVDTLDPNIAVERNGEGGSPMNRGEGSVGVCDEIPTVLSKASGKPGLVKAISNTPVVEDGSVANLVVPSPEKQMDLNAALRAASIRLKDETGACSKRINNSNPALFWPAKTYLDILKKNKRIVFIRDNSGHCKTATEDGPAAFTVHSGVSINYIGICSKFLAAPSDMQVAYILHELSHATYRIGNDAGWTKTQYREDIQGIANACNLKIHYK